MNDNVKCAAKIPAPLILASFIIVVAVVKAASSIRVPFFMAVLIAVICTPPLFCLQRKGVPKVLALVLILAAILIVGLLFGALIVPSLNDFLRPPPDYQERLLAHIAALISWPREKGVNIPQEEVTGAFNTEWVLGPIGVILPVPMTSLVKIALEGYEETRGLAIMLGSGAEIEYIHIKSIGVPLFKSE